MLASRNFAGLSILTSEITPENFRLIYLRLAILQNNLQNGAKCWSVKCELVHVTSPNLLGDFMSLISRYWPRFKSLWSVELKTTQLSQNLVCIVLIIGSERDIIKKSLTKRESIYMELIFLVNFFLACAKWRTFFWLVPKQTARKIPKIVKKRPKAGLWTLKGI